MARTALTFTRWTTRLLCCSDWQSLRLKSAGSRTWVACSLYSVTYWQNHLRVMNRGEGSEHEARSTADINFTQESREGGLRRWRGRCQEISTATCQRSSEVQDLVICSTERNLFGWVIGFHVSNAWYCVKWFICILQLDPRDFFHEVLIFWPLIC